MSPVDAPESTSASNGFRAAVDTTVPSTDATTLPPQFESEGIGEVIPGFPDTLVTVSQSGSSALTHVIWPVAGPEVTRPLPVGGFAPVKFDQSGEWLAMATDVPDSDGLLLSVGIPSRVTPLVSNVTSFSWHDSRQADLSYMQLVDGALSLWVVHANRVPELAVQGLPEHGQVAAWGDWGWAVQDPVGASVLLFDSSGELIDVRDGVAFDSAPNGSVVIVDEGVSLVNVDGTEQTIDSPRDPVGTVVAAGLSPDGLQVAVLGTDAVEVAPLFGDGEVIHLGASFGVPQIVWSSDSRFVVVPAARGVMIIDTQAGLPQVVQTRETIRALGVIPLTASG